MQSATIRSISAVDARFPLPPGAGTDAVHQNSEYSMAMTVLEADSGITGTGLALTLGNGNRLVCDAIRLLSEPLANQDIEELMAQFGRVSRNLAEHPSLRWLGPHKGVVHLALASITNACFDLWAKYRRVPLWKLLLHLTPQELAKTLDLTYLEDILPVTEAVQLLESNFATRTHRENILSRGYPGYDTSIGWMAYDDDKVRTLAAQAIHQGFCAIKLKVGSKDPARDLRRAAMLREVVGDSGLLMFDANQHWNLSQAMAMCRELARFKPFWIEEPTHPDDIFGHAALARELTPVGIAAGEHIPNRVLFKNFMQYSALHFVQADCTRLAGVSEFLTVSLLAKKFNLPVLPHVGDMGQIHQHLVLFNHIALAHEVVFLEHIPHLRNYFALPATIRDGLYITPQEPGASTDMVLTSGTVH